MLTAACIVLALACLLALASRTCSLFACLSACHPCPSLCAAPGSPSHRPRTAYSQCMGLPSVLSEVNPRVPLLAC
ncbi:hypothetical protein RchiOBHm_Chr6g0308131 [Rosa chinensis]|uniref:Secreted protein n=1 Tax=Rosa chinensis TaxID=74649 RepID=A0A2P6Q0J6_ROSCH|nr:hypothetical protein RchiOBHm_Chr6g0308131 [Rosa chinensis]